jgi:hypothetical protein
MNRDEAIAIITSALPELDDAQAAELTELAQALKRSSTALSLSDEDRAGIARGRQDFVEGRTYSSAEARAVTATFLSKLRRAAAKV